jgi:hypothetical protein
MFKILRRVFILCMDDIVFLRLSFVLGLLLCVCTGLCLCTAFGFLMDSVSTESTFGKGLLFDLTLQSIIFSKFMICALMRSFRLVMRIARQCTEYNESIKIQTDLDVTFCIILPLAVRSCDVLMYIGK